MKPLRRLSSIANRHQAGGFTLLEVMLAFVVFALSFATVLEIMAGSMRAARRASDDTEIALFAQSVVDLVGTELPLAEGEFSGMGLERYQWNLVISPYLSDGGDERILEVAELSGTLLLRIDLDISWMQGHKQRDIHFSTVRSTLADRS